MEKSYFDKYRENLIKCSSIDDYDKNNSQRIYADWCGSGRIYEPIEMEILNKYGPYYSNLHSSSDNPSIKKL